MVFEVAPIADYKTKEDYLIANGGAAGDVWAPVPAAGLTTCSFAPEATCARVDHKTFRIQVNSGATLTTEPDGKVHLKGDVGPFQNPFSENQFKF